MGSRIRLFRTNSFLLQTNETKITKTPFFAFVLGGRGSNIQSKEQSTANCCENPVPAAYRLEAGHGLCARDVRTPRRRARTRSAAIPLFFWFSRCLRGILFKSTTKKNPRHITGGLMDNGCVLLKPPFHHPQHAQEDPSASALPYKRRARRRAVGLPAVLG